MKNRHLAYHYEAAKIYSNYYKSSFNLWRLLKSVLSVLISGSFPTAGHYRR
jgi:hypothetical protein